MIMIRKMHNLRINGRHCIVDPESFRWLSDYYAKAPQTLYYLLEDITQQQREALHDKKLWQRKRAELIFGVNGNLVFQTGDEMLDYAKEHDIQFVLD
jgi:hypothetical protein